MNIENKARFKAALNRFDEANSADPNQELIEGNPIPKERLYAQRMSEWMNRLYPEASEALQLAARSQHICRWEIPRSNYPSNRAGYLQWRNELKQFHADKAAAIMQEEGYDQEIIDRVKFLLLKKQLRQDAGTQALEDVVCLVFLQYYFPDFAGRHEDSKVISILQKTWKKMSTHGQNVVRQLDFPAGVRHLVERALSGF